MSSVLLSPAFSLSERANSFIDPGVWLGFGGSELKRSNRVQNLHARGMKRRNKLFRTGRGGRFILAEKTGVRECSCSGREDALAAGWDAGRGTENSNITGRWSEMLVSQIPLIDTGCPRIFLFRTVH